MPGRPALNRLERGPVESVEERRVHIREGVRGALARRRSRGTDLAADQELAARFDTRPHGGVQKRPTLATRLIEALARSRWATASELISAVGLDPARDTDYDRGHTALKNLYRLGIVARTRDAEPLTPWVYVLTESGAELATLMATSGERPDVEVREAAA